MSTQDIQKQIEALTASILQHEQEPSKMNNEQIHKQLQQLFSSLAQQRQEQQRENKGKLVISGLDVTLEQLVERGDAQESLIKLHNAMLAKINHLEERIEELEQNAN
jgi:hypothetical protein